MPRRTTQIDQMTRLNSALRYGGRDRYGDHHLLRLLISGFTIQSSTLG